MVDEYAEELKKNYFTLKGKGAEEIVQYLAEKTFLADWCYKNPLYQRGKELCDLLVVFGEVAIIWQIKNLKLRSDGRYSKGEVSKNLRQLSGARRRLFEIDKPIELTNTRRGKEIFNPKSIKQVYLISALIGKGEDYFAFVEQYKNLSVHVFNREFTEIVLNELDTVSDFVDYLKAKEVGFNQKTRLILLGGEEELLAFYLMNGRSFDRFKEADLITIEEGCWSNLGSKPEFKAKKEADKISYLWDKLIGRVHDTKDPSYELIAREMAKLNRFERRYYGKVFLDAHIKAHKETRRDMFRRVSPGSGTTYCFLFMDDPEPRERRKGMLFAMCHVARGKYPQNKTILGVATEKNIRPTSSFDFCLYIKPNWTPKDQAMRDDLQKKAGILVSPNIKILSEDEYPSSSPGIKSS
jgi:hypothetical protein